jgi:hypothetical protein
MKLDTKTALGIDISDDRISMALLKKGSNGIELVKAASGPVPAGAIKNGGIEDPVILAKGIRELKNRNRIRVRLRQTAVSLVARPVLLQIIDAPKQVPTSIGQFLHNEVKHCVALSGKKIALDFSGIGSAGLGGSSRLFMVATDSQKVAQLAKACTLARVNLEAVEPAVLAYIRALYTKKIAPKFDQNVLIAILRDKALTLCVFKKQIIDFIRTRDIILEKNELNDFCQWLSEEINTVIQFYNIEVSDSAINWVVTVIADGVQLPKKAEKSLKAKIAVGDLQIRRSEDLYQDISVTEKGGPIPSKAEGKTASAVAIGLAMKLLGQDSSGLRINLIPPEASEVKSLKKHAIVTANIMAAVLLLMVLAIGGLMWKIERVNAEIIRKREGNSLHQISVLIDEDKGLDNRMKLLSEGPSYLNEILKLRPSTDWLGFLNDLRRKAPKTVRITSLSNKGDSQIFLEGLALSYEAVHLFVNMLDQSKFVAAASLIEAEKDDKVEGLIKYAISCSIATKEGKPNAD